MLNGVGIFKNGSTELSPLEILLSIAGRKHECWVLGKIRVFTTQR